MSVNIEPIGTQLINLSQQVQEIAQQTVVVAPSQLEGQNAQSIQALPVQQNPNTRVSPQNLSNQRAVNQDCNSTTSPTMRFFVIIATIFMGLYSLITYLINETKKFILWPITKLFDGQCVHHQPDDLCLDCTGCQQTRQLPGRKYSEQECCICYNQIKNKVIFPCQHSCCAECTIQCWENGNNKKIKCMYCRKNIDMIYRDFQAEGDKYLIDLRQKIRQYNSTFAPKNRSLYSKIRESPFLFQRTINFIFTREGIMYMLGHMCSSHFFIVGLLYILSPLDLLPECIFGIFGMLDDVVVLGILFVLLTNFYYRYLLRQDQENSPHD
ncbi:hypothetical protein ABPG74_014867 [Tetrahymena malaccensis]